MNGYFVPFSILFQTLLDFLRFQPKVNVSFVSFPQIFWFCSFCSTFQLFILFHFPFVLVTKSSIQVLDDFETKPCLTFGLKLNADCHHDKCFVDKRNGEMRSRRVDKPQNSGDEKKVDYCSFGENSTRPQEFGLGH